MHIAILHTSLCFAFAALTHTPIWLAQLHTYTFNLSHPSFNQLPSPFTLTFTCSPTPIVLWHVVGQRLYWPGGSLSSQVSSTQNNKASDPSTPATKARVSPYHLHPHTQGRPPTFSHYMYQPFYIHPHRALAFSDRTWRYVFCFHSNDWLNAQNPTY